MTRWTLGLEDEHRSEVCVPDILEMCASGGLDVAPIMAAIAAPPISAMSAQTLSCILLYDSDFLQENRKGFYEVSAEQTASIARALRNALSAPPVLSLLERAAMEDSDDERAALASEVHQIAESLMG